MMAGSEFPRPYRCGFCRKSNFATEPVMASGPEYSPIRAPVPPPRDMTIPLDPDDPHQISAWAAGVGRNGRLACAVKKQARTGGLSVAVETGRAMLFPRERPDSFWWTCPRQKTWSMSRCGLADGDAFEGSVADFLILPERG
jgi:hypothetical protein